MDDFPKEGTEYWLVKAWGQVLWNTHSSGKNWICLKNTLGKVRGIGTVKTMYIAFRKWIMHYTTCSNTNISLPSALSLKRAWHSMVKHTAGSQWLPSAPGAGLLQPGMCCHMRIHNMTVPILFAGKTCLVTFDHTKWRTEGSLTLHSVFSASESVCGKSQIVWWIIAQFSHRCVTHTEDEVLREVTLPDVVEFAAQLLGPHLRSGNIRLL